MALDPHTEDFQRLGMRFAASLDGTDPFSAARAVADFGRRYRQQRDRLPQTDADRAFGLVTRATDLIDYQLPFSTDEGASRLVVEARKLLLEALDVDRRCHDARRMLAAAESPSPNDCQHFLSDGAEAVRADCERARAATDLPGEAAEVASALAMRPYVRWLAAQAACALVCGRYRLCVRLAHELLGLDPTDAADVRLTLALAYAKLEDDAALDTLCRHAGPSSGLAWYALARMACAFKRGDRAGAEREVSLLLRAYPHAGTTLSRQDDLPDGVFARIVVAPMGEDELILATSEATVLLQEGCDASERGTLGSWLAGLDSVARAQEADGPMGFGDGETDGPVGFGDGEARS